MSAKDQIRERIEQFVDELNDLIRKAALEAVSTSLQGADVKAPTRPGRSGRGRAPATPAPAPAPSRGRSRQGRGPGGKRPPEQLEQLTQELLDYITVNPGEGIESIARGLGQPSKDLQLPMKKLLAADHVEKRGQKRSTKYFPA